MRNRVRAVNPIKHNALGDEHKLAKPARCSSSALKAKENRAVRAFKNTNVLVAQRVDRWRQNWTIDRMRELKN